jgi:glycosyltransferase involved in cell wall biosynthesis
MKIAFYSPNKPLSHPQPSGDLAIARGLQQAMKSLGHRCEEIVEFRSRWFWQTPRNWLAAAASYATAFRSTRDFQPDVWLTYHTYYKSPDVLGPLITRLQSIPYVLFQPMYGTRRRKNAATRIGFYLNWLALNACAHAFTNNVDDLEALHRILPSHRISYIPPGIFPEEFRFDNHAAQSIRRRYQIAQDTRLLMAAAMFRADVKSQSLIYLFRSLALLRRRREDFILLVVGDGPMAEDLKQRADELLPGKVVFAGLVSRDQMSGFYSAADLFVFPGIGESLGMVYLEAQACGCPVVALDTAGAPQVIKPDETGLLVPDDGGESFCRGVERLMDDHELRKKFSINGPLFIQAQRNLHLNYLLLSTKLQEIARVY